MQESGKEYYSVEALATGMRMYNETLLKICQVRQVECLDLASLLSKDTTVFYDDVHFNETGAEKVAEALTQYMLQHKAFKESDERVQPRTPPTSYKSGGVKKISV